jgi:hypothetical protein
VLTSLDDVKSVVAEAVQKRACSIAEIGLEHFYRADWLRTDAKRSRLLKYGIFPHNIAPARVDRDWDAVCEELRSSLEMGRKRPRLPIAAFDPAA